MPPQDRPPQRRRPGQRLEGDDARIGNPQSRADIYSAPFLRLLQWQNPNAHVVWIKR
jgi:hypothetical protein